MQKSFNVAVVGATGLVGREMLAVLGERGFPVAKLVALASENSVGETVEFQGEEYPVQKTTARSFEGIDICLMSAGSKASEEFAPLAAKAGAVVIDNSSQWRMDSDVPLVVPEVNPQAVAHFKKKHIIANPNCSTIQMVVPLFPLHQKWRLKRVVVATYQAVSGKGKRGIDELSEQMPKLYAQDDINPEVFPRRIAFNLIPHVDAFLDDGFTKEERKMRDETRKIMSLPRLDVVATCVRVPVFNGHSEAVVAEFESSVDADQARQLLKESPGVMVLDEPLSKLYPTPIDVEGSDATFVGRVRRDPDNANVLAFFCVADNVRKGAATNAVQIAEILVRDYLR